MYEMNRTSNEKRTNFGYLKFKPFIFESDGTINFIKIFKIFNNINQLIIFNSRSNYDPSISLNSSFMSSLYSFLSFMNGVVNRSLIEEFEYICIIEPKFSNFDNLDGFIKSINPSLSSKYLWWMEKRPYYDAARNAKSDNCLYIAPMPK